MHPTVTARAFSDELSKIAGIHVGVGGGAVRTPLHRVGRRPIGALRLAERTKAAVAGGWQETPYSFGYSPEGAWARRSRTKAEVLSDRPSREDGREMATMVPAVNVPVAEIAVTSPSTSGPLG